MYSPNLIIENNHLTIVLDRLDRLGLLQDSTQNNKKATITLFCDVCESLVANGYLEHVLPEEIGALTDAPILKSLIDGRIYWYPNYAITDPVDDLILDGYVKFDLAPE